MKQKQKPLKQKLLLLMVFLAGLGVFLYPNLSNIYAEIGQARIIWDYKKEQKKMEQFQKEEELKRLQAYNQSLEEGSINYADPFEENEKESEKIAKSGAAPEPMKNPLGDPLGHIEIPKIGIDIPFYKGTSDRILQRAVGLLEGSSMPVGGENTHAALTGHRGLPSAELFTDIVRLEKGDTFYIHSVAGTLAYEVEKILTVLPHETDQLKIQKGRDLATLITCTPYMINTHRLLITGKRVPYVPEEQQAPPVSRRIIEYTAEKDSSLLFYAAAGLLLAVLAGTFVYLYRRKKAGEAA